MVRPRWRKPADCPTRPSRRETADFNTHWSTVCLVLQPLRVNGVKVYTENVDKRQVIMDLQIRYAAALSHTEVHTASSCQQTLQAELCLSSCCFPPARQINLTPTVTDPLSVLLGTRRLTWTSRNTTAELESKVYRYGCTAAGGAGVQGLM